MALQPIGLDATLTNVPDFTGGIDKMNRSVDSFAKDTAAAMGKAAGLTQDAAGRWRAATGRFASDAELAAAGIEKLTPAAKAAGDAAEKAGRDAVQGGRGFDAFGEIVTGALRHIGTLAVDALLKAGQAVAGFVKDSIGLAGTFEANMLQFQSVAGQGVDTKGLEEFRDLFLDIGKRLPVSTSEVQQAAIEMVKGGIDPATIAAGGLEQNIQFAAAAMGGDLVKAAEISSKIMGGWAGVGATAAEKAEFLTHATDLMARAANASATDVEGLSRGIFQAQGIARTAGVSFDDLTTTLALLAPRFASSAEAGTSVKNMIARLQPTTDPATQAMQRLGLYTEATGSAFYDAAGNFVGFETAGQLLQDSLKGLTKEQQAAALQTIFGNDAMGAAAALAEVGAQGYQNMAAALENANGVQAAAALKQQGFNTALDNAKGSVEALQITIGSALLPVLTELMNNVVAPAVNTLTDFASALFGSDEAMSRLSPTMQDLVTTISVLVADIQNIVGAFDDAGAMSSEFGESIGLLATDLGLPGELIQDIVFAVQDLITWFSTASEETSTLGSAVEDLSGVWTLAGKVISDVMAAYAAVAKAILPIVTAFVDEHGDEIGAFFKQTWDSIVQIVTLALQLYNAIVPPILNAIAGFISAHGDDIQTVLGGAWDVISGLVTGALALIEGAIKISLGIISGDWSKVWTDIQAMSVTFTESLGQVITGFLNIIAGFFETNLNEIVTIWQNNWNMLVDIATSIDWANIGYLVIAGIIGGIDDNADRLMNTLRNLASDALQAAKDALGISSPSKEFAAVGESAMQGIMMGLEQMIPALLELVNQTGGNMIDALKKNISKGGDEIRAMMADLTAEVKDIASQINDAIADGFGATASIDRQIAKNLDKFKDIPDKYKQYTEGALKEAQTVAAGFADPTQGAKFFKMRSDQILEFAKLQQDMAEAETQEDADRIQQQMILINAAQTKEIQQWEALQAAMTTPMQDIAAQIQALFQSNELAGQLPGILENQIIAQLTSLMHQLQSPPGVTRTPYNPNAVSTTNTTTLNMPIYTNQSPGVLQDSMAIAGAALL